MAVMLTGAGFLECPLPNWAKKTAWAITVQQPSLLHHTQRVLVRAAVGIRYTGSFVLLEPRMECAGVGMRGLAG